MSFGADIGAIWRSSLDTEDKAVLTSIRYHGDAGGAAAVSTGRLAAVSGLCRRTLVTRLASLVARGWVERRSAAGKRSTYLVHAVHQCTPCTSAPDAPPPSACDAPGAVHAVHQSPTPPNKVFQTFSRPAAEQPAAAALPATMAMPQEPSGGYDPDVSATLEAYRRSMAPPGGRGVSTFLPPGLVAAVLALHSEFGGAATRAAIAEAVVSNNAVPNPKYVRRICERIKACDRPALVAERPAVEPVPFTENRGYLWVPPKSTPEEHAASMALLDSLDELAK